MKGIIVLENPASPIKTGDIFNCELHILPWIPPSWRGGWSGNTFNHHGIAVWLYIEETDEYTLCIFHATSQKKPSIIDPSIVNIAGVKLHLFDLKKCPYSRVSYHSVICEHNEAFRRKLIDFMQITNGKPFFENGYVALWFFHWVLNQPIKSGDGYYCSQFIQKYFYFMGLADEGVAILPDQLFDMYSEILTEKILIYTKPMEYEREKKMLLLITIIMTLLTIILIIWLSKKEKMKKIIQKYKKMKSCHMKCSTVLNNA